MGVSQVPGLEQNYQYGLYGQGSKIPFGGLTVGPKVTIPTQHSYVDDGNGNKISMGQDGVGLAHRDAKDYGFMLVA